MTHPEAAREVFILQKGQLPQLYMMVLGVLLILCVMYLPGGLASLRWAMFGELWQRVRGGKLQGKNA